MSRFFTQSRSAFIYMMQTGVSVLAPLFVTLVVARYVMPEAFGEYAISQVFSIVATGVLSLGLHIGYERNYFLHESNPNELGALHYGVVLLVASLYGVAILTIYLVGDALASVLKITASNLLVLVLAGQSVEKLALFYLLYFRNGGRASHYAMYSILSAAVNAIVALVLVVHFELGILGVAWGYLAGWGAAFIGMALVGSREIRFKFNRQILKDVVILSLPITARSLTVVIGNQSDKILLGMLNTMDGLGIYSLANRIGSVINSYNGALQNVYTPYFYESLFNKNSETEFATRSYLNAVTFVSLFPVVVTVLFAKDIVWLLFPNSYQGVAEVLILVALYYGATYFGKIISVQLLFGKKTGLVTMLSIIFAFVNVGINIPMIFYFGVIGAAVATLLSGACLTYVSYYYAQRVAPLEWQRGPILALLLFACGSALASWVCNALELPDVMSFVVRFLLFLMYIALGIKLEVISLNNWQKFRTGLANKR